jgi:DNA-directed RNA polymerase subunit D
MKLEISKEEGNRLQFEMGDVSTSFANAVRRYAMNAVKVLAMDEVTFYDNTSALFDEYLAHRIGLIPLVTPSGVPKDAEIEFYLDATGPKVVYSADLETKDKDVKPAREKIPIVTLTANQQIRLEAKARLGTARQHAKYQAGLVAYEIADGTYKFLAESFYQMGPRELLSRAASALDEDLEELEKQLEKAKKKK